MKIKLEPTQQLFFTSDTHYNHKNICRGVTNWNRDSEEELERTTRDFPDLEGILVGQKRNPWDKLFSNDLLLVPSLHEGDGLVVVEALAAGIPILLADIPEFRRFGLPDIHYCKDKYDYIASINSYSNHIDQLRVSAVNAASVLDSRSLQAIGDSWVDFFNKS